MQHMASTAEELRRAVCIPAALQSDAEDLEEAGNEVRPCPFLPAATIQSSGRPFAWMPFLRNGCRRTHMRLLFQVMLLDDETAPYVVGECLVHLPREQVEERLQTSGCHTSPAWHEAIHSEAVGRGGCGWSVGAGCGQARAGVGGKARWGAGFDQRPARHCAEWAPPSHSPTTRHPFLLDPARLAALDETQAAIKGLEGDIRSVKVQMAELKTLLYAKFGNSVSKWGWHTEEGTGPGVDAAWRPIGRAVRHVWWQRECSVAVQAGARG